MGVDDVDDDDNDVDDNDDDVDDDDDVDGDDDDDLTPTLIFVITSLFVHVITSSR